MRVTCLLLLAPCLFLAVLVWFGCRLLVLSAPLVQFDCRGAFGFARSIGTKCAKRHTKQNQPPNSSPNPAKAAAKANKIHSTKATQPDTPTANNNKQTQPPLHYCMLQAGSTPRVLTCKILDQLIDRSIKPSVDGRTIVCQSHFTSRLAVHCRADPPSCQPTCKRSAK
jgi:hypothetical protein